MKHMTCPKEVDVLRAAFTDKWEESLRAHVVGCTFCEEIVQVSRWMLSLAQSSETDVRLPDPILVWRRARLSLSKSHEDSLFQNNRED
jgi:hypothetical protein